MDQEDQDGPGWTRMDQDGPGWTRMDGFLETDELLAGIDESMAGKSESDMDLAELTGPGPGLDQGRRGKKGSSSCGS